ncbi:MAG: Glucodextranase, domain [Candidatus Parcubacteria bacterium]|jgi:hypothetical protein
MTRTSLLRILKIGASILLVLIVAGYSIWRSSDYARGPRINITDPLNWSSIQASTTPIHGIVERAHIVTMNGKPVSIDEAGNFSEIIIVFPGTNLITFIAKDQFGRSVEERLILTKTP